jgi:hypothetical protein
VLGAIVDWEPPGIPGIIVENGRFAATSPVIADTP